MSKKIFFAYGAYVIIFTVMILIIYYTHEIFVILTISALIALLIFVFICFNNTVHSLSIMSCENSLMLQSYDTAAQGVIICDYMLNIVFYNKTMDVICAGKQIKSLHDLIKILPHHWQDAILSLKTNLDCGNNSHIDLVEHDKENISWWRVSCSLIKNSAGHTLWNFTDIKPTPTSSYEMDLPFLQNLFHQCPFGIFGIDANNTFIYVNYSFCKMLDATANNLISSNVSYWTTGPLSNNTIVEIDFNNARKNKVKLLVVSFPSHIHGVQNYIAFHRDADASLIDSIDKSQKYFDYIFDNAPIGILIIDEAYNILTNNKTFIEMVDGQDVVKDQSNILYYIIPEDSEIFKRMLNTNDFVDNITSDDVSIRLIGSKRLSVYVFMKPFNLQPHMQCWILYLVDITAKQLMHVQIMQLQKMQTMGQLVSGITHDFNNLLTAMIGFCDLLLERYKPNEQSFNEIVQIKQNANRAANLVRQLLTFARNASNELVVIDVHDILSEVNDLLKRLITPNIHLIVEQDSDKPFIKIDSGQMEQVLLNLAINARDSIASAGTIRIRTSNFVCKHPLMFMRNVMHPGDYLCVEVQDSGIGIQASHLTRIFDPFFSTKKAGAGTGLGLSTVYNIIQNAGGFISVKSSTQKGTLFKIFLPTSTAPFNTDELSLDKKSISLIGNATILIVEDEQTVRNLSSRALKEKGYTVIEAENGPKALDIILQKGDQIDLMVTDMIMPDMDGMNLIKLARQYKSNLKVICVSGGYAGYEELKNDQHTIFLAKPFTIKDLAVRVKEMLTA